LEAERLAAGIVRSARLALAALLALKLGTESSPALSRAVVTRWALNWFAAQGRALDSQAASQLELD